MAHTYLHLVAPYAYPIKIFTIYGKIDNNIVFRPIASGNKIDPLLSRPHRVSVSGDG